MVRRQRDFYQTAPWQVRALLANQPIRGLILEPCAGDGSISNILRGSGDRIVVTNDIDPERAASFALDARDPALYEEASFDWVVTNPPYTMPLCTQIVEQAVKHARIGVAMMLRISFREPTVKKNPRGPFLAEHPISRLITLPRYSYTGDGKSDSVTTEWAIWLKEPSALPPILSLPSANTLYSNEP